jgi:sugar lactone lactonase YvrE
VGLTLIAIGRQPAGTLLLCRGRTDERMVELRRAAGGSIGPRGFDMPGAHRLGKTTALALAMAVAMPAAISVAPASAQSQWEVVASGLDNPRHLTFSPGGDLYVAEAGQGGTGPCSEHPELGEFCLGFSGAVTRVRDRGPDQRVLTGLPSIINEEGETLGPSDIAFTGRHKFVLSVGLGGSDEFRAGFGSDGALLATLVSGTLRNGPVSLFADVLANEAVANPDGTDIDSNPVGLLRQGGRYVVADAGGNAVVRASHKGSFTTIAALPPGSALAPPFLGLPPGTQIPTDAVPTSVVRGPDGAYYVSQLTGFPFEQGDANIWRVVPGQAPTVFASGLTNLTDLAFARDGTLYAVEIASTGLLNEPIGALVRITPGASQHTTVAGGLFAPYGVALTRDSAYVTTCAVCVGGGEVIKVPLD